MLVQFSAVTTHIHPYLEQQLTPNKREYYREWYANWKKAGFPDNKDAYQPTKPQQDRLFELYQDFQQKLLSLKADAQVKFSLMERYSATRTMKAMLKSDYESDIEKPSAFTAHIQYSDGKTKQLKVSIPLAQTLLTNNMEGLAPYLNKLFKKVEAALAPVTSKAVQPKRQKTKWDWPKLPAVVAKLGQRLIPKPALEPSLLLKPFGVRTA